MERYNEENDFAHYYEMMSKKTTAELEKELAKLEKQADKYRPREFVGFRMTPQASRKLDVIAQQKMKIQTILYERENESEETFSEWVKKHNYFTGWRQHLAYLEGARAASAWAAKTLIDKACMFVMTEIDELDKTTRWNKAKKLRESMTPEYLKEEDSL